MLATLLVTAPPGAASRTVSQSYTVPSNGVLKLTGHGYGHGHGMSQYGARGAARQGLTHRQILAFYYPGTAVSSIGRTIRVLITADTDNDVRVVPASGLRVRKMGGSPSYLLPTPARTTTWRLRTVGGKTVLDYYNGSWHAYKPGGKALSGAHEFYRPGSSVTLRVAGTTRAYRGVLRLDGSNTINALPLDDYVKGVVPREMPTSWETAAVRAQAVAARTYAAFDRAAHSTRSYHTCDTTSCQVYGGLAAEDSRGNAAVAATQYQVLTYKGDARVHAVRLQQRRLALGRQHALPGRQGRQVRRLQRQPDAHLEHHRQPRGDPAGVALAGHPQARRGDPARRPRSTGTAGSSG